MSFKIDLWDIGAAFGGLLIVVGLGLIAWPLILVGVGALLLGGCFWGAKKWASSPQS